MIVNGQVHFTGSNRNTALKEIDKALALETSNLIELSAQFLDQNQILVSYKITGELPVKSVLNLALVERGITTEVKRGENGGRTLHQDNVVLVFESGKASAKSGKTEFTVTPSVNWDQAMVIAYLQSGDFKTIHGASQVSIKR